MSPKIKTLDEAYFKHEVVSIFQLIGCLTTCFWLTGHKAKGKAPEILRENYW